MKRKLLIGATLLSAATQVFAAEPAFEVSQTVYSYTSTSEKTKTDEGEDEAKLDSFNSMPSSLELQFAYEKWVFGVAPLESGSEFEVSRAIMPNLELGLELGYAHADGDTDAGETKTENISVGPHVTYIMNLGAQIIEAELHVGYNKAHTRTESENPTTSVVTVTETKEKGYEVGVEVSYDYRLTDNLNYSVGIAYTYGTGTDEIADEDLTSGELEVTLLRLRYGIY